MFRALLSRLQEALNKQQLVYCLLRQLAAAGLEWNQFHSNPGAPN
jgi:hypothetical protein